MSASQAEEFRRNAAEFRRTAIRKIKAAISDLENAATEHSVARDWDARDTDEQAQADLRAVLDELENNDD